MMVVRISFVSTTVQTPGHPVRLMQIALLYMVAVQHVKQRVIKANGQEASAP